MRRHDLHFHDCDLWPVLVSPLASGFLVPGPAFLLSFAAFATDNDHVELACVEVVGSLNVRLFHALIPTHSNVFRATFSRT